MKIGQYNDLIVKRVVDFGIYLSDPDTGTEVLLPAKYVTPEMILGQSTRVFVYTDSEDRPIATTERPLATVGEFVYLQTIQVNRIGAFMDWGIPSKNLLVPFREQKVDMRQGCQYLVYVYLDDASGRVVASAKIEKFLGNVIPEYQRGDKVKALVTSHEEIGWKVIVDNLHRGMIYESELYAPLEIGSTIEARVKGVRPDGKIDLIYQDSVSDRLSPIEERILHLIDISPKRVLGLGDHTSPEEIRIKLGCSKKDFKRAVGHLYRHRRIVILPNNEGLKRP